MHVCLFLHQVQTKWMSVPNNMILLFKTQRENTLNHLDLAAYLAGSKFRIQFQHLKGKIDIQHKQPGWWGADEHWHFCIENPNVYLLT